MNFLYWKLGPLFVFVVIQGMFSSWVHQRTLRLLFKDCRSFYFHSLIKATFLVSKGLLCLYDKQKTHGCLQIWNFSYCVQVVLMCIVVLDFGWCREHACIITFQYEWKKKHNLIKTSRGSFHPCFTDAGLLFDASKCMRCQGQNSVIPFC